MTVEVRSDGEAVVGGPGSTPVPAPVAALRFEHVGVRYRDRLALDDVTVSIGVGERVALVGPNGAGKSTLLRLASGVLRPATGRVELLGTEISRLGRPEIAHRLAVVPQQASLPFAIRVEEVVGLGRLPYEHPLRGGSAADSEIVAAAIERVGLSGFVGRDARELSLGERQLVLLAMAVAQQTPILVLDEPTVHLDLRHQVEAMELVRDLNVRDRVTVVAVLHDLWLAAHFFDRILLLDGGRLVADGPPAEVLSPDRIRGVFGVDPGLVRLG